MNLKALRFHANIPRYLFTRFFGKFSKSVYYRGFPPLRLDEVEEPQVKPDWVKIKTVYTGICGSDINMISLKDSPLLEPLCSFPCILGHESTGIIEELGAGVNEFRKGDRVVIDPILGCKVRDLEQLCQNCSVGNTNLCENFDRGDISPGFDLGWCRDVGGAFSPFFITHKSQLYKVPDNVSNENAVLVEPFSIGLHAVIRHFPQDTDTVLVVGVGVIGIMVIVALRAWGSKARIIAIDKADREDIAINKCGADHFIRVKKDYYKEIAKELNLRLYRPILEKKDLAIGGGADIVYECVGIASSIDDALRFVKGGGQMILIGNPEKINIDWSLIWSREIQLLGSFGSCLEENKEGESQHAFKIALDLMSSGKVDLSWMITHKFKFPKEYKKTFHYSMNKERYNVNKAVFSFQG